MAAEKAIQRATSRTPALEGRPALQQYIKQMSGEIKKALPEDVLFVVDGAQGAAGWLKRIVPVRRKV